MFGLRTKDIIPVTLSLLLLGGAAVDRMSVLPSKDPAPYHRHVREVAAAMPTRIGDWVAQDVSTEGTKEYLHANVMIDRQWTNSITGRKVAFLFTQCPDVRDLLPHYPPVCYPGRGLTQLQTESKQWSIGDQQIEGTEYGFESNDFHQANSRVIVDNFMLLPGGVVAPDMKRVKSVAPLKARYYGMGQVQVVFSDDISAGERDAIFTQLVSAHKPLIDAILAGRVE